jgi:hypothetical protein
VIDLAATAGSRRIHAALAAAALAVVAGPFLFGRGVDVPDDFLYSVVSTWEGLRFAVLNGQNPFFLPGRMGGVSLFTEANQMGPLYPAMWPALLLPVRFAIPLAFLAHAVGALVGMRWLARVWGASEGASTAAALTYACGMFGLALFIEAPADAMPVYAWFPVILACHRKLELADGVQRRRWAILAGLALAAMLSGAHIRHAGGTCGALGIWFLLRWRVLPWSTLLTVVGLCAGATGIVPAILEFQASQADDAQIAGLAVPPLQTLRWSFAASWLAPKPFVTAREFGLGAILGAAFAFGFSGREQRSLVQYVAVLLICAAGIPGVRFLLTPLTFLAHPVLILYYALAMAPAAVIGALGLDRLAAMDRGALKAALRGPPGILLGTMVLAVVARLTPLGWDTFGSSGEWTHWVVGLVQAGVVLAAAAFVVVRFQGHARLGALLLLLTVDLLLLGVRVHTAVPSQPLNLGERAGVDPVLSEGYLHINELAVLLEDGMETAQTLSHVYTEEDVEFEDVAQGGELEDILGEAPELQARLLDRTWPIHPGSGFGWRSTSGRTKLAPPRASAMLLPLARALNGLPPFGMDDTDDLDPWYEAAVAEHAKAALVADGIGARTQQLFGVPVAVDETGTVWRTPNVLPRCYSPASAHIEPSQRRRVRGLLESAVTSMDAVVEAPLPSEITAAEVTCDGLEVAATASGPALIVLNERLHPGWHVDSDDGPLVPIAVNQVHMGVVVPAGTHRLTWTFRPPGLRLGLLISGLALLLALLALRAPARRS